MHASGKLRILLLAALALRVGCINSSAVAQVTGTGSGLPASHPPVGAAIWRECRDLETDQSAAIESAHRLLDQTWLTTDRGLFAAYTMPGEKRNPFDLSPATPDAGPRDGHVQAQPPGCTYRRETDETLTLRFIAPFYRFHEAGHGWSPPLRDGLMLEVAVSLAGSNWQARDIGSEQSILLPEQKPRRADDASLPAETRWAVPIPPCGKRLRWNGKACVPRKK
jgi:hypothetical protein